MLRVVAIHTQRSLWDTQKQYSRSEHLHVISECRMHCVQEKFYGPSFFRFVIYFLFLFSVLVKKPSPVDIDLPVNFFLSRTSREELHGKLIIEQDSSRRRRKERGCLGQHLPDRWMWRGGVHLLATTFSRLDSHEFISLEICGKSSYRYHQAVCMK